MRHGVAVLPGTGLDAAGGSGEYLRLHFLAPAEELSEAVRRMAAAWRGYRHHPGRTPTMPTLAI